MPDSTPKYLNIRAFSLVFAITLFASVPCSAQNVGIGTAAPLEKLHVIGNIRSSTLAGVGSRILMRATNYDGSDRRLKKDIKPMANALQLVDQIAPVSYQYNTEAYPGIGLDENRLSYGFIAQDLEQVMPGLVKDKLLYVKTNKEQRTYNSNYRFQGNRVIQSD